VEFAERSAEAAGAVVAALDADQQARATFAFDDEGERTSWAYFPRNHPGLPLHAMDLAQQKSVHRLLTAALSLPAYAKVCAIMSLESVLNEIEQRIGDRVRDPGRYFISIFGAPGEARWGWRFEGHHVALNFTFEHGELFAATPLFLGANPAAVRHGDVAVIRPCGEEEDAARALMEMLDTDQRRAAIICDVAPPDFVLMNLPLVPPRAEPGEAGALPLIQDRFMALAGDHRAALAIERDAPRGIPSSALRADQRRALEQLIEVYVHRLPEALHTTERARIGDDVWFAWAGAPTRREGHYYRLQSPSFLVEYDNTQDDANHVHAVWRDPTRDFGIDALRRHVASGH
jgi:hypothetical protein